MIAIPCDNHVRTMLDGAPTDHFDPVFASIVANLEARGGLAAMRRLDGRVLIALDGSEHFCSRKIRCPDCLAPNHKKALPSPPEFVRPQNGAKKKYCETAAAKS